MLSCALRKILPPLPSEPLTLILPVTISPDDRTSILPPLTPEAFKPWDTTDPASIKILPPETATFPPKVARSFAFTCKLPAAIVEFAVTLPPLSSAIAPNLPLSPTASSKAISPPTLISKLFASPLVSKVLVKVISPDALKDTFRAIATALLNVMLPAVIFPATSAFSALTFRLVRGMLSPTPPPNCSRKVSIASSRSPSTLPGKIILPRP